jgi:DNA-binding NtrC family response regulator
MIKTGDIKILLALTGDAKRVAIVHALSKKFSIETASDAEEAYHAIHKFNPDIAILDYNLSKINPIDVFDGVSLVHHTVYYVICVTNENLEVARRVWKRRAMDFIIKPYDVKRFVQDINKLVRYVFEQRELKYLRKRVKALETENELLKRKEVR